LHLSLSHTCLVRSRASTHHAPTTKNSMACGKVACGICCGVTVVAIVLILFFFWPRNVEGCINTDDLAVTAWSLNSTSFAVAMSLPARVKNENYFAIDFDTIDVTVIYLSDVS